MPVNHNNASPWCRRHCSIRPVGRRPQHREWLPLLERCRYIGEWVAVKQRWDLTVDQAEKDALILQASNCDNDIITVIER